MVVGTTALVSEPATCVFGVNSVWKWAFSTREQSYADSKTHVKHDQDPIEVRPPGSDCPFVCLGAEDLREYASCSLLDNVLVDRPDRPAIPSKGHR